MFLSQIVRGVQRIKFSTLLRKEYYIYPGLERMQGAAIEWQFPGNAQITIP